MAAPMYNFAIPSTLSLARPCAARRGDLQVHRHRAAGPAHRQAYYVLTPAVAGIYAGSSADHQEPYLRQVMESISITTSSSSAELNWAATSTRRA